MPVALVLLESTVEGSLIVEGSGASVVAGGGEGDACNVVEEDSCVESALDAALTDSESPDSRLRLFASGLELAWTTLTEVTVGGPAGAAVEIKVL